MTAPTWPTNLPPCFTSTSYQEEGADNVLRSENSKGPAKSRRVTTAAVWKQTGQMVMSTTQYKAFLDFVRDTISSGAKAFYFPDRFGEPDLLVRMVSPHKTSRVGNKWYVSMELEVLP
jgi:hypothetical protein